MAVQMNHTSEPWRFLRNEFNHPVVVDKANRQVAMSGDIRIWEGTPNMERIAACVNFLAGYSNVFLAEMGSLGKLIDHLKHDHPDLELHAATITDYNRYHRVTFHSEDAPSVEELHDLAENHQHYTVKVYREDSR